MHRRQRRCAARQCKRDIRRSVLRNGMVQTGHRASSAHTPRLWHQHQHLQTGCPPPCAHEVRLQRSRCCWLFSVVFDAVFRYDYVVVGHFLPWKRSWIILQKSGRRLAIGEVYVTKVFARPAIVLFDQLFDFCYRFLSPALNCFQKLSLASPTHCRRYDHIEASLQMVAHFSQEGVTVSAMVPAHELADIYRLMTGVYAHCSRSIFHLVTRHVMLIVCFPQGRRHGVISDV